MNRWGTGTMNRWGTHTINKWGTRTMNKWGTHTMKWGTGTMNKWRTCTMNKWGTHTMNKWGTGTMNTWHRYNGQMRDSAMCFRWTTRQCMYNQDIQLAHNAVINWGKLQLFHCSLNQICHDLLFDIPCTGPELLHFLSLKTPSFNSLHCVRSSLWVRSEPSRSAEHTPHLTHYVCSVRQNMPHT